VANRGVIPAEILPYIFDPFRGGDASISTSEGLGLGLYIVQQIVEAHHGRISVDSAEGRTTFRVQVPRQAREVVRL
jgi:signal transduction histidine kinase